MARADWLRMPRLGRTVATAVVAATAGGAVVHLSHGTTVAADTTSRSAAAVAMDPPRPEAFRAPSTALPGTVPPGWPTGCLPQRSAEPSSTATIDVSVPVLVEVAIDTTGSAVRVRDNTDRAPCAGDLWIATDPKGRHRRASIALRRATLDRLPAARWAAGAWQALAGAAVR